MPFVVTCPTCRHPMSVAESPAPYVVACPTCRLPLTVPAATGAAPDREEDFTPVRRPRAGTSPVVPVTLCLVFFGLVGVIVWLAVRPTQQVTKGEPDKAKVAPRPPAEPREATAAPQTGRGAVLSDSAIDRVKSATVLIRVRYRDGTKGSGSGFVVSKSGWVVTNAHVVGPGASSIDVVFESGTRTARDFPARVAKEDTDLDLAVLQVTNVGQPIPEPLSIGSSKSLKETHEVFIFGFPLGERLGSEITVSKSSVSSIRQGGNGINPEIQLNGGAQPGSSGGPVVDAAGNVVGVVVSKIRGAEIAFAIPSEAVKGFLP